MYDSQVIAKQIANFKVAILGAFPDGMAPSEKELLLGAGGDIERLEVASYYRGKKWRDIEFSSPNEINDHNRDLGALSSAALKYYLPCLLINGLNGAFKDFDAAGTFLTYLLSQLNRPLPLIFNHVTSTLNEDQRAVIRAWFDLINLVSNEATGSGFVTQQVIENW